VVVAAAAAADVAATVAAAAAATVVPVAAAAAAAADATKLPFPISRRPGDPGRFFYGVIDPSSVGGDRLLAIGYRLSAMRSGKAEVT
jgi:hypothetical protein